MPCQTWLWDKDRRGIGFCCCGLLQQSTPCMCLLTSPKSAPLSSSISPHSFPLGKGGMSALLCCAVLCFAVLCFARTMGVPYKVLFFHTSRLTCCDALCYLVHADSAHCFLRCNCSYFSEPHDAVASGLFTPPFSCTRFIAIALCWPQP
ncbi:hypothetical protein GQ54DRAFT_175076 [Martensiomyces pterosporus]|nr:hypothetical protein GQ54DRAFT_175076 [Martensiomyces pterosporus]